MQTRHAEVHQALAVLAPPRRFELLMLLLSGVERSVSQLARAVKLSQSCTSRHLQALAHAGLVKGVRDGKRVVFRPAPRDAAAAALLASLAGDGSRFTRVRQGEGGAPPRRIATPAPVVRARRTARVIPSPATGPTPPSEPGVAIPAGASSTPGPVIAAIDAPPPQAEPESGNYTLPPNPSPRFRRELEDYLL